MRDNFVNVIGYQFERVHTGIISWIFDSKNLFVTMNQKYEALRRLYRVSEQSIPFKPHEISSITCMSEYSFGRKLKIDLVIRIDLLNQRSKYFVIEMKVDSIPYKEQLEASFNAFNNSEPEDVLFLLLMFGSSQICKQPNNLYGFKTLKLPEILEVFSDLHIDHYIYSDWMEALREEDFRRTCISSDLINSTGIWEDKYWKAKGYRLWFSLFYYLYHELKQHSKFNDTWDIYSGSNNPVMNWNCGWLDKNIVGHPVKFYWEFNYEEFILKVQLDKTDKLPESKLKWLRNEITSLCNSETIVIGRRAHHRYGVYNSIYKWKFDFKNQNFFVIMNNVELIIDQIHPRLYSLKG